MVLRKNMLIFLASKFKLFYVNKKNVSKFNVNVHTIYLSLNSFDKN